MAKFLRELWPVCLLLNSGVIAPTIVAAATIIVTVVITAAVVATGAAKRGEKRGNFQKKPRTH